MTDSSFGAARQADVPVKFNTLKCVSCRAKLRTAMLNSSNYRFMDSKLAGRPAGRRVVCEMCKDEPKIVCNRHGFVRVLFANKLAGKQTRP